MQSCQRQIFKLGIFSNVRKTLFLSKITHQQSLFSKVLISRADFQNYLDLILDFDTSFDILINTATT